jgi:hypothetical protein
MTAPNSLYQEGYSMTDTTDQQAVTVAQEDPVVVALREINEMAAGVGDIFPNDATAVVAIGQTASAALDALDARLASVSSASAEGDGQDRKFAFRNGQFVNRVSGEPIPHDEPVIIFRARDNHSLPVLREYLTMASDPHHRQAIKDRMGEFAAWRAEHPDRVKEPGITHHIRLNHTPEPVPATNQAGEVEIVGWLEAEQKRLDDEAGDYLMDTADCINVIREKFAALATQPATSQENVMRKDGSQFTEAEHARYIIKDDCPPTVHARLNAISNRWESPVEVRK